MTLPDIMHLSIGMKHLLEQVANSWMKKEHVEHMEMQIQTTSLTSFENTMSMIIKMSRPLESHLQISTTYSMDLTQVEMPSNGFFHKIQLISNFWDRMTILK